MQTCKVVLGVARVMILFHVASQARNPYRISLCLALRVKKEPSPVVPSGSQWFEFDIGGVRV